MADTEIALWAPAVLAFLGAVAGASISHFGLRYTERQKRFTRFDSERLDAYSTYVGCADKAVFQATCPDIEDRLELLEAELNRMRTTVGRVQLLAKTEKTRNTAYVLLDVCSSLYAPVSDGGRISVQRADACTTEAIRNLLAAARAELEIKDQAST